MKEKIEFIKGFIEEITPHTNDVIRHEAIYKIINIDDNHFIAKELATGCIFPINITNIEGIRSYINHPSLIKQGKVFANCKVKITDDDTHSYIIDEEEARTMIPTIDEINEYLSKYEKNAEWHYLMTSLEAKNTYIEELATFKIYINEITSTEETKKKTQARTKKKKYKPVIKVSEISKFGYDLSTSDNLCNLIGREEIIKQVIKKAFIRQKSILLVGPSGSGKTSIVEKIATEIRDGNNKHLQGKILFYLNLNNLIAGTRNRGEFEANIKFFVDFCIENKGKIVVFIDEIHNLYHLGNCNDGSYDAMNILKTPMAKGDIVVIGATTNQEYTEYMLNDPAFIRRLVISDVTPPTDELNIKILRQYIKELEEKDNIKLDLSEEEIMYIIKYILEVTDKSHQNKVGDIKIENPTLAKNILEDAFDEAIYNEQTTVTINDLYLAILNCDKLSPSYKKERAHELKETLTNTKKRKKILTFK